MKEIRSFIWNCTKIVLWAQWGLGGIIVMNLKDHSYGMCMLLTGVVGAAYGYIKHIYPVLLHEYDEEDQMNSKNKD